MSKIEIEINGKPLQVEQGATIIEVADEHDISIPRFCYHKKLSVAANCRMCLVEVDKAPKPMPACSTPVTDGMKVFTKSPKTIDAQKSVMEFLLINHPLDCPICDQGGECELQDVALSYGSDVSRYNEGKRVIKDKNLGSLISTDMTRCIFCTRCVRFGDEVAGMRELGMTGRGENSEIGTYIEQSVRSEISGNVIDLCPVGALTSKPFRFAARAWELQQHKSIAPHDCVGSHIHVHTRRSQVMRVLPRENEAINQVWLSDRDRFSYEGVNSSDRITTPRIKRDGKWQDVDWSTALNFAADGLKSVISQQGASQVGALIHPSTTLEEQYLLQKLLRSAGCHNIDHRLQQVDFAYDEAMPLFPDLGMEISAINQLNSVLLIGSYMRYEQPLLNLRLRKAQLKGAQVHCINPIDYDFNFAVAQKCIGPADEIPHYVATVAKVLLDENAPAQIKVLLASVEVSSTAQAIAASLKAGERSALFLGASALNHPAASTIFLLADFIAKQTN